MLVLIVVASFSANGADLSSNYNVLVVHSSYEEYPWTISMNQGIHDGFKEAPETIEFWTEYIDTKRNLDPRYFDELHSLFRTKYGQRDIDLIIAVDNEAFDFVMEDRSQLFPDTPLVFVGYIGYTPDLLNKHQLITGVVQENSFEETIELALKLHPETETIAFILPDAWPVRVGWVEHFPEMYAGRVDFVNITENTLESIDRELSALGDNIVVIPLNSFLLESGEYLSFEDLVSHLASKTYPVYGLWDIALGHGIVGGELVGGKFQGGEASRLALKILRGSSVDDVPVVDDSPNKFMFDWNQLDRFNVNLSDLPENAIVIDRPNTFYERNKVLTWVVISIGIFLTVFIILLSLNIRRRQRVERKLSYQASHDSLTGLVNRREFERRALELFSSSKERHIEHALCYMDLDQFKIVNDNYGHNAGDQLLRQLSEELIGVIRQQDTLARLGGDEFGLLMEGCSLDNAARVATSILEKVQAYQFSWEGRSLRVGVSIGLVSISSNTSDLTQLLKNADAACYMAKDKGRNRIHIYNSEDTDIAQRHGEMRWVERLYQALEKDQFCLYAQAIVPLSNRAAPKHYEILLRMINESGDIIPPGEFLPAAENYNLIGSIDRWVLGKSIDMLVKNTSFQRQINFCSINLSGQSLCSPDLLAFVIDQLAESGLSGDKICFEITETAAISNLEVATKFILTLKGLGCRFALDDFGSGLSSFAYLKTLPVNYLKIDGMFVKDIVDDPIDFAMVKSINEIGQVMGMQTIAEFVENEEIEGMLRSIGVNYAQGYGIQKPEPFDEVILGASGGRAVEWG